MTTQQTEKQNRRPQYVRLFTIIAIGLIIVSGIHFISILNFGSTTEKIADSIFHLVAAAGFFGASRLVNSGRQIVIYLLGIIGIFAVLYGLMMDRGFNPITFMIQGYFIWQMLNLSKNGELT